MCNFENGFKLCTCSQKIVHHKKSRKHKQENKTQKYTWELCRAKTAEPSFLEIGFYYPPKKDIGQGLEENWVLLNLNLENCFDFEYTPQEDDCLTIKNDSNINDYMAFIFKNNQWITNNNDPFQFDLKTINKGKII